MMTKDELVAEYRRRIFARRPPPGTFMQPYIEFCMETMFELLAEQIPNITFTSGTVPHEK